MPELNVGEVKCGTGSHETESISRVRLSSYRDSRTWGCDRMKSDLEIAQEATLRPITEVAGEIGIQDPMGLV